MDLPGLSTSLATVVTSMLVVDGALLVFVEQGAELSVFRREGSTMVPLELPYVLADDMTYLDGRQLFASDGHRVAHLAVQWAGDKAFLGWDGAAWSTRRVSELPPHRNLERYEVRELVSTGNSKLANLAWAVADEPGHFGASAGGLVWQPPSEPGWVILDSAEQIPDASAITDWDNGFVVAGIDFDANTTTLWELDPLRAVFTEMGTLDGRVIELAGGTEGLVAKVVAADNPNESTKTVWHSPDGHTWTHVDMPGTPTGLCTDGERIVAVWMSKDAERVTVGLRDITARGARPIGATAELEPYRIADGWHETGRCGIYDRGVISIHVGYEGALANLSPLSRIVRWTDGPNDPSDLTPNVTPVGSAEALILDIAWTGHEWIAVGSGSDTESSKDALLWRSSDGLLWKPGETIAGGPGNQEARSVLVEDGQLLIGGVDVQQATFWVLPA
jgi:hypothetical protein